MPVPLQVNELYETAFVVNTVSSSNSVSKKSSLSNKKNNHQQVIISSVLDNPSSAVSDSTYSHIGYPKAAPEQPYSTLDRIQPSSINAYRHEGYAAPTYDDSEDHHSGAYSTLGPRDSAPADHPVYNTLNRAQMDFAGATEYASPTGNFANATDFNETISQAYEANYPLAMQHAETSTYNTLSEDREANAVSSTYSTLDHGYNHEVDGAYNTLHSQTPSQTPATQLYNHIQVPTSGNAAYAPKLNFDRSTKPKLQSYEPVTDQVQTPTMLLQSYEPSTYHGLQFAPDEDL